MIDPVFNATNDAMLLVWWFVKEVCIWGSLAVILAGFIYVFRKPFRRMMRSAMKDLLGTQTRPLPNNVVAFPVKRKAS